MTKPLLKSVAIFLVLNILFEISFPTVCYALTGGPSQPEMESFEPVGTTDMVDLFSGDFTYNIPLFDVGGYPVNIAYHSGISMDQEASWVGLGWNINAGVINRTVRGLPDDFKADPIAYETNIRDNITWSLSAGYDMEFLAKKLNKDTSVKNASGQMADSVSISLGGVNANFGITQNNYKGLGFFFGTGGNIPNNNPETNKLLNSTGVGIGASSQGGFEYDVSFRQRIRRSYYNIGMGIGSRNGLKEITIGWSRPRDSREKKRVKVGTGLGHYASIPLSHVAALPQLQHNMKTAVQNYRIAAGWYSTSLHHQVNLAGTYSRTSLSNSKIQRGGYGYMYAHETNSFLDGVQDFSRERDGAFSQSTKNLPLSASAYDFLNVSGQGTGGMFRPHRHNVGVYADNRYENVSSNWANLSLELGFSPGSFKLGADFTPSVSFESSGVWDEDDGNELADLTFDYNTTNPFAEPFYFQVAGEHLPVDMNRYNALAGESAVRLDIDGRGLLYYADVKANLETSDKTDVGALSEDFAGSVRQPRSQLISILTAGEVNSGIGSMVSLRSYYPGAFDTSQFAYRSISRLTSTPAKGHHIGEITQTNPDGTRYVYAIPAYNNTQQEVSFNTGSNSVDYNRGLVSYSGTDNSLGNSKGLDWYYNRVTTPGYAHSFLLTAVLSPNYVDADQDGKPSINDIGDYVMFHYSRHDSDYKWRVPVEASKAQYSEGLKSDLTDNKGNYIYGTKEIWYLHTIESRTHVAEFKTSARADALGVTGENGGKDDGEVLMKLDTIVLFAKPDRLLNGEKATPVKKVVFEYDYSLCKNVPNNTNYGLDADNSVKGKLTLKKLYFLYGHSGKGSSSPYRFSYDFNPDYNMADYDRWGNYKPNNETLPNRDYPYVEQTLNRDTLDKYAAAWNMNRIQLPSGGVIAVNYEADDYAFVQDKKAMEMVKIVGATDQHGIVNFNIHNIYNKKLFTDKGRYRRDYLVFKLPQGITSEDELRKKCFSNIDHIYFKFLMNISGKLEYVAGWCEVDKNHIGITGGDGGFGYVKIQFVKQGDWLFNRHEPVNAISRTTWQFAKMHMSKVLNPGSEPANTGVSAFKGLMSSFGEAADMFRGQYQALKVKGIGAEFVPDKSWIRMESPTMKKVGGGCRVRSLSFSDSWQGMDDEDKTTNYDQEYTYTKTDEGYGAYGYEEISSGVATYEPMIGGEENSVRQLKEFIRSQSNAGLPVEETANEEPFGESFYPGPSVGYSQVTVKRKPKEGVERTGTGYSVNEFYTARDFPVRVLATELRPESFGAGKPQSKLTALLRVVNLSYYAASQGYSVIINDMHGKPKSTAIYSQMENGSGGKVLISKVSYEYQMNNGYLDNAVKVLNNEGEVEDAVIGKEIDVSVDLRQNERTEINGGLEVNLEFEKVIGWVIPIPSFKYTMNRMQSASVTKVIQQYGILKTTTVQDEGSIVKTTNLLYDKVSGGVLLTQTSNTFNDPVYQFTYPAHMAYDGMGPAYKNTGAQTNIEVDYNGVAEAPDGFFVKGDEVRLKNLSTSAVSKAWVLSVTPVTGSNETAVLIDRAGQHVAVGNYEAKIIISGRKNMTGVNVGDLVMKSNPVNGNHIYIDSSSVISASANTFKDSWPAAFIPKSTGTNINDCDIVADTFIVQTFQALLAMIRKVQAEEADINPHRLINEEWFDEESALYRKIAQENEGAEAGDLYFRILAAEASLGSGEENFTYDQEDWHTFTSIRMHTIAQEYSEFSSSALRIDVDEDCGAFSDVDTFYTIVPNNLPGASAGIAKAIMLNGDTCEFEYQGSSGFYDQTGYVSLNCITTNNCAYVLPGGYYNPFLNGRFGQWRPYQNFSFIDNRSYNYEGDTTFIRKDGLYQEFVPYWTFHSSGILQKTSDKKWVAASSVTRYSQTGKPVEAVDALGNSSAELYTYAENFVTASSSYAKMNEIANDHFEDYSAIENTCTKEDHWNFRYGYTNYIGGVRAKPSSDPDNPDTTNAQVFISKNFAHTGTQSLGLPRGMMVSVRTLVDSGAVLKNSALEFGYNEQIVANRIPKFAPVGGKQYVISAWVKGRALRINEVNSFDSCAVYVQTTAYGSPDKLLNVQFKASGPVIDGWQRIEGTFTIPSGSDYIAVTLENRSTYRAYFDDIRIHPYESNMKTYVYHPVLLKVMAILDENNFASFYEYDKEGKLIRVKKETVKGVMTIQESRSGMRKPLIP